MCADYNKEVDFLVWGLVDAVNKLHDAFTAKDGYDTWHRDITSVVSGAPFGAPVITTLQSVAPAAADLPSCSVLGNELFGVLNTHFLDDSAHLVKDLFNDGYLVNDTQIVLPLNSQTLVQVANQLNVLKDAFNTHIIQTGVHIASDGVNTITAANATSLSTAITLANAIQTSVNAHISSGPKNSAGATLPRVRPVGP